MQTRKSHKQVAVQYNRLVFDIFEISTNCLRFLILNVVIKYIFLYLYLYIYVELVQEAAYTLVHNCS